MDSTLDTALTRALKVKNEIQLFEIGLTCSRLLGVATRFLGLLWSEPVVISLALSMPLKLERIR
jgi:hypothetical protein